MGGGPGALPRTPGYLSEIEGLSGDGEEGGAFVHAPDDRRGFAGCGQLRQKPARRFGRHGGQEPARRLRIEEQIAQPGFWDDSEAAQKVGDAAQDVGDAAQEAVK